ncbi:hypothetical protein PCE1_000553 [Barthelona sp. PCE]
MSDLEARYHIHDIGAILSDVQNTFSLLRQRINSGEEVTQKDLEIMLDRAEYEIGQKANTIVQTISDKPVGTLSVTDILNPLTHSTEPGALDIPRRPTEEEMRKSNYLKAVEVLGKPPKKKRLGRTMSAPIKGNLYSAKTSGPKKLLPIQNRRNPNAPLPQLTVADIKTGALSLQERGLLPTDLDLAPILPLTTTKMKIHTAEEAAEHRLYETTETEQFELNLHNVRLNVSNQPDKVPPFTKEKRSTPKPKVNVVTMEFTNPGAAEEPVEEVHEDVEEEGPRDYDSLQDEFGLHTLIMTPEGLLDSPEKESFLRTNLVIRGHLIEIIKQYQDFLNNYGLPSMYIDGKRLVTDVLPIFLYERRVLELNDLLIGVANRTETEKFMKAHPFTGLGAEERAAVKIQAVYRGYVVRKEYHQRKLNQKAIAVISDFYLAYKEKLDFRKYLEDRELHFRKEADRLFESLNMETDLTVLLSSCASSTELLQQRLSLPLILSPRIGFIITDRETQESIYKALQTIAVLSHKDLKPQSLFAPTPQDLPMLPISTRMLVDNHSLGRLRNMLMGKRPCLVPVNASLHDWKLAVELNTPLYGPHPSALKYSKRSGVRRLFQAASVAIPFGQSSIFNSDDVLPHLSVLIVEKPSVTQWVITVNDNDIRAFYDTLNLPSEVGQLLVDYSKEVDTIDMDLETKNQLSTLVLKCLLENRAIELEGIDTWPDFMLMADRSGCVIEEVVEPDTVIDRPTVHLEVFHDSRHKIHAISDTKMYGKLKMGEKFPYRGLPPSAFDDVMAALAGIFHERKIVGFITVSFLLVKHEGKARLIGDSIRFGYDPFFGFFEVFCSTCSARYETTGLAKLIIPKDRVNVPSATEYMRRVPKMFSEVPSNSDTFRIESVFNRHVFVTSAYLNTLLSLAGLDQFYQFLAQDRSLNYNLRLSVGCLCMLNDMPIHDPRFRLIISEFNAGLLMLQLKRILNLMDQWLRRIFKGRRGFPFMDGTKTSDVLKWLESIENEIQK